MQIRVVVYDSEYPDQTSTAVVPVIVTRNANAPIFERPEYRQALAENHQLGSSVLQLKASDQDKVGARLKYKLIHRAEQLFRILHQETILSFYIRIH